MNRRRVGPSDMRFVRGGDFSMGSETFYEDERPVRRARVGDFWIDETPVTNDQFATFVDETGYVIFAELAPDPAAYPGMPPEMAIAGSAVFVPPDHAVLGAIDPMQAPPWWRFVFGADWRHPRGPHGAVQDIGDHPVVHVVAADAEAYARWAGERLPAKRNGNTPREAASRGRTRPGETSSSPPAGSWPRPGGGASPPATLRRPSSNGRRR
jgi:formylglycine-generating enzyme required for sulfatase activity